MNSSCFPLRALEEMALCMLAWWTTYGLKFKGFSEDALCMPAVMTIFSLMCLMHFFSHFPSSWNAINCFQMVLKLSLKTDVGLAVIVAGFSEKRPLPSGVNGYRLLSSESCLLSWDYFCLGPLRASKMFFCRSLTPGFVTCWIFCCQVHVKKWTAFFMSY